MQIQPVQHWNTCFYFFVFAACISHKLHNTTLCMALKEVKKNDTQIEPQLSLGKKWPVKRTITHSIQQNTAQAQQKLRGPNLAETSANALQTASPSEEMLNCRKCCPKLCRYGEAVLYPSRQSFRDTLFLVALVKQ